MKLNRFITQEEYERLVILSTYDKYQSDNKSNYYHAERLSVEGDEDLLFIRTLLKEVVAGFVSFSNFVLPNTSTIRLQYNWNYGTQDRSFQGVGYISLEELRDGFEVIPFPEVTI